MRGSLNASTWPLALPYGRVHEDGCVDTDDIIVEQDHRIPPVFLYVVLELYTVWSVVVDSGEALRINFRTWEDKAIFLTVAYNLLEYIFFVCHYN